MPKCLTMLIVAGGEDKRAMPMGVRGRDRVAGVRVRRVRSFALVGVTGLLWLVGGPAIARADDTNAVALKIGYEGTGSLEKQVQNQPCDTSAQNENPCFDGPSSDDLQFKRWFVQFPDLALKDGAGEISAPVTAQVTDWHDHTTSKYYRGDGAADASADCQSDYVTDPAGPPLELTAAKAGSGFQIKAEAPYKPTFEDPSQLNCYLSNFAESSGTPDLQSALRAVGTVPRSALEQGGVAQVPVSSNDSGVTHLPSDCTADAQAENSNVQSCSQQLEFSGFLDIRVSCGHLTFHELSGKGVSGSEDLVPGQIISTAANERKEFTFPDGSVMRMGPSTELQVPTDCFTEFLDTGQGVNFKLILGSLWQRVNDAVGNSDDTHDIDGNPYPRAIAGVRGSSATYTVPARGANFIIHVIEGTGFIKVPGKAEFDFPAGTGESIDSRGHHHPSAVWPAAARNIVPPGQRPPSISRYRVTIRHRHVQLRFTLAHAERLRLQARRGAKTLRSAAKRGHRGKNTITLPGSLSRGHYDIRLTAVDSGGRTTLADKTVRVP